LGGVYLGQAKGSNGVPEKKQLSTSAGKKRREGGRRKKREVVTTSEKSWDALCRRSPFHSEDEEDSERSADRRYRVGGGRDEGGKDSSPGIQSKDEGWERGKEKEES